jgi:hypothetical protein
MRSEIIVTSQLPQLPLLQQCVPIMVPGRAGCLVSRRNATDRHACVHKMLFAQAKAWRAHDNINNNNKLYPSLSTMPYGQKIEILKLCITWRCLVLHTPADLTPEEIIPELIEHKAGWALESVWTQWGREKSLPVSGIESRTSSSSKIISRLQ